MGKPNVVIKIATILSSLLLVGGCVSYRTGVFDAIPETKAQNAAPENQTDRPFPDPPPPNPAEPDAKKPDAVIFNGTKAPIGNSIFVPNIVPK